jgi:hypothetical protein
MVIIRYNAGPFQQLHLWSRLAYFFGDAAPDFGNVFGTRKLDINWLAI